MNSGSRSQETYPTWCPVCEYRRVTQLSPSPLCSYCWNDKYGTITIDGVKRPFKEVLKDTLVDLNLWFKDGETREEWQERMEVEGRSALQRYTRRKTG